MKRRKEACNKSGIDFSKIVTKKKRKKALKPLLLSDNLDPDSNITADRIKDRIINFEKYEA